MDIRVSVAAGTTSPWILIPDREPVVVVCAPGSGGTMKAQASWSPVSVIQADNQNGTSNAVAIDWPFGTVSAATVSDITLRAKAIRFVATTAAGIGEIA